MDREDQRPRSGRASSEGPSGGSTRMSANQAKFQLQRERKSVEGKACAIESRIRHLNREEAKIWRDLEAVRRQAATIEEGKSQKAEKRLAERTIEHARVVALEENKVRAAMQKQATEEQRARAAALSASERQRQGQAQAKIDRGILRQKRAQDEQAEWRNQEKVLQAQHARLEAKTRAHQEKMERFVRNKASQEAERLAAEAELDDAAAVLPSLEAEESRCLERLHNSRRVTQSVLEELESSLGSRSSLTSLLRSKSGPMEPDILEEDLEAEPDLGGGSARRQV